jgi:ribosomal protein S18 acetylase RimI-like enzyme
MITIELLEHRDAVIAGAILELLVQGHAREAALLKRARHSRLLPTVDEIRASGHFYLGALSASTVSGSKTTTGQLAGTVGVGPDDESGQIAVLRLTVQFDYQRQGIARRLLLEAFRLGAGAVFSVITPRLNTPALALYRDLGFKEYRRGVVGLNGAEMLKLRRPPDHPEKS